ncbi:hypothetical protein Hte_000497 [Hypoxylon texense]
MPNPWDFNEAAMQRDEEQEQEQHTLLHEGEQKVNRIFSGFIDFAFSGNILEIAFGLMSVLYVRYALVTRMINYCLDSLATSFTAVTTSLVSDILLPPLSIILPLRRNMNEKFAVLRPGPNYNNEDGYNTLDQAQNDGAIVLAYGVFLNRIINFLGIGLALYGLANLYQYLSKDPIIKHSVKCRYCKKRVSSKSECDDKRLVANDMIVGGMGATSQVQALYIGLLSMVQMVLLLQVSNRFPTEDEEASEHASPFIIVRLGVEYSEAPR